MIVQYFLGRMGTEKCQNRQFLCNDNNRKAVVIKIQKNSFPTTPEITKENKYKQPQTESNLSDSLFSQRIFLESLENRTKHSCCYCYSQCWECDQILKTLKYPVTTQIILKQWQGKAGVFHIDKNWKWLNKTHPHTHTHSYTRQINSPPSSCSSPSPMYPPGDRWTEWWSQLYSPTHLYSDTPLCFVGDKTYKTTYKIECLSER